MMRWVIHPFPILFAALLVAAGLLSLPLGLAIGANDWDIVMHVDGAYRVGLGQVPHRDFFAPAGALPFMALAFVRWMFPQAHPLLAGQIGLWVPALLLTGLAVALARATISRGLAFAVVAPLAVAGLLPVNATSFYPQPGFDAIGLYNRQTGFLLYALVAILVLVPRGAAKAALAGLSVTALAYIKINGFVAGAALVALAWLVGLLRFREGLVAAAIVVALTALWQIWSGLPAAYVRDLADMARHNAGAGFSRLMTLVSVKFATVAGLGLVTVTAVAHHRRDLASVLRRPDTGADHAEPARLSVFLAGALPIAIWCESQNTGSQEFLFLWPLLACLAFAAWSTRDGSEPLLLSGLIAFASLPTAAILIERAARPAVAGFGYHRVGDERLAAMGRALAKPEAIARARAVMSVFIAHPQAAAALADRGELPEAILYSQTEYQVLYRNDLADLLGALRAREQAGGRAFATVFTLDAADPVPLLAGLQPLKEVTISFDPTRGYPAGQHPRLLRGLREADAILRPRCPETPARRLIERIASPELAMRQRLALTPCWDAYVKP